MYVLNKYLFSKDSFSFLAFTHKRLSFLNVCVFKVSTLETVFVS